MRERLTNDVCSAVGVGRYCGASGILLLALLLEGLLDFLVIGNFLSDGGYTQK